MRDSAIITYPMQFTGVVYQIDHTLVDVLVKDLRKRGYQRKSGETRLWLSLNVDSRSRKIMGARFGYDRPDRHVVAAIIRDGMLPPHGGKPDEIWVDHGKELLSKHIRQLTRGLGIELFPCPPHQPQLKGIVERFFGTLNTRLWSTLPGYVGSNTTERSPKVKAELTPSELIDRFWEFIDRYHDEPHSATGMTPLDFWAERCFAEPVDPRHLDILLKEAVRRRVLKLGIKYRSRVYWHSALAMIVGEDVLVRSGPSYAAPDEIEVFHSGQWVCTAFAVDSETGRSVTREQVRTAKRDQKAAADGIIEAAREALREAEREIEAQDESTAAEPSETEKVEPRKSQKRRTNLLDRMEN